MIVISLSLGADAAFQLTPWPPTATAYLLVAAVLIVALAIMACWLIVRRRGPEILKFEDCLVIRESSVVMLNDHGALRGSVTVTSVTDTPLVLRVVGEIEGRRIDFIPRRDRIEPGEAIHVQFDCSAGNLRGATNGRLTICAILEKTGQTLCSESIPFVVSDEGLREDRSGSDCPLVRLIGRAQVTLPATDGRYRCRVAIASLMDEPCGLRAMVTASGWKLQCEVSPSALPGRARCEIVISFPSNAIPVEDLARAKVLLSFLDALGVSLAHVEAPVSVSSPYAPAAVTGSTEGSPAIPDYEEKQDGSKEWEEALIALYADRVRRVRVKVEGKGMLDSYKQVEIEEAYSGIFRLVQSKKSEGYIYPLPWIRFNDTPLTSQLKPFFNLPDQASGGRILRIERPAEVKRLSRDLWEVVSRGTLLFAGSDAYREKVPEDTSLASGIKERESKTELVGQRLLYAHLRSGIERNISQGLMPQIENLVLRFIRDEIERLVQDDKDDAFR
jgi:hypothetical protein